MYRSILVPLDGSPFGEHALPLALGIARRAKASLKLVHVHVPVVSVLPESAYVLDDRLDAEVRAQHGKYLEDVAQRLRAVAPVAVTTTVIEGEVAAAIHAAVAVDRPDLIVMTTHGRGPFARFWLGSVADELVRDLPAPMLLVRPEEKTADLATVPPVKTVLVPLDGTSLAEQVLPPAAELAKLSGATLCLLRIIQPPLPEHYRLEGAGLEQLAKSVLDQIEQIEREMRQEAQTYLERTAARLREQGVAVQVRVETGPQPAAAILTASKVPGADAIALATHGRGGLQRFLVGSVADKVIRGTHLPVLVLRPAAQ